MKYGIILLVVSILLFCCNGRNSKINHPIYNQDKDTVLSHQDSMDVFFEKQKIKNERRLDSLKALYPQAVVDKLFAKKDSVFRNILLKQSLSDTYYKKKDWKSDYIDDITYYTYKGKQPVSDSIAFWIYLDKYESYSYQFFWVYYFNEKDTIIQIDNQKFQYLSFYDKVYFGNQGIVAYPTILKPDKSDELIFFNFDTVYTDNKYLYTMKASLHGDNAIYSKFEYRNNRFYLLSDTIAKARWLTEPKK